MKSTASRRGGVTADARESIQRDTATLATEMDTELEESDPFTDVEEDVFDIAIESQTRAHVVLEY